MVEPNTGLYILVPILKLHFITKLIFINLSNPLRILAKLMTLLTTSWIIVYIYICISPLLHHYPLLI